MGGRSMGGPGRMGHAGWGMVQSRVGTRHAYSLRGSNKMAQSTLTSETGTEVSIPGYDYARRGVARSPVSIQELRQIESTIDYLISQRTGLKLEDFVANETLRRAVV